jgi:hypothetical protein
MRHVVLFLAVLLLCGCATVPKDRLVGRDEWVLDSPDGQAIRTLFDGVDENGLGSERFIVLVIYSADCLNVRPVYALAWFRYAPGDQSVAVDYLSFPLYEKGSDLFGMVGRLVIDPELSKKHQQSANLFYSFLKETVQNKGLVGVENAKRIDVPLPAGLRDDALLNEMCKYTPTNRSQFGHGSKYYWSIKTNELETINNSYHFGLYDDKINQRIESQILRPIHDVILERETPDDWHEDYRKWQEDWPRIYKEQQEIRQRLRQKSLDQAQGTERTE